MANMCRNFLTAARDTTEDRALVARERKAAVLGDRYGYVVEFADGEQYDAGRQCCRYCARVQALIHLEA